MNAKKSVEGRRQIFFRSVKYGPIFVCISCHRSLFEHSVESISDINNFKSNLEDIHPGIFNKTIGNDSLRFRIQNNIHICLTCKKFILSGKMPPMSNKNNLQVFNEYK